MCSVTFEKLCLQQDRYSWPQLHHVLCTAGLAFLGWTEICLIELARFFHTKLSRVPDTLSNYCCEMVDRIKLGCWMSFLCGTGFRQYLIKLKSLVLHLIHIRFCNIITSTESSLL